MSNNIFDVIADKPDCRVTQSEDDDFILLTCEADANPEKVDFVWQRGGNETVTIGRDRFSVDGLSSTLRLELNAASFGTYFWDGIQLNCNFELQHIFQQDIQQSSYTGWRIC